MKKTLALAVMVALLFSACGSSSSSSNVDPDAAAYAVYGSTVNNVIPSGLKEGGANLDIAALLEKTLSGQCESLYEDCPYITATGGGDSMAGEILMRIWGLDYQSACTETMIVDGTCFTCADCGSSGGVNYIKPTMLASPTSCATTSTTAGRYVNFGVDPCFFDTIVGQINNIKACETVQGGDVSIVTAVPWYASWGFDEKIKFSSFYSSGTNNIWWTVNAGATANQQDFFMLNSDWLYVGKKDTANDRFIFFGTGSPTYYQSRGEGYGVNIAAYAGTLSSITKVFEAIQVRVQDPNKYIERLKSNGTHVWYQSWADSDFPSAVADLETVKDSPSDNRCVLIGTKVVNSKYVPFSECVTSFGVADVDALNLDSGYILKLIDGTTASAISFTTSLTPTVTSSSCLTPTTP